MRCRRGSCSSESRAAAARPAVLAEASFPLCPSRGCPLHLHRRPHEHYSTYVGGFCYSVLSSRFRRSRRHLTSHLKNHWVANITERFSLPPAELTGPVPCTAASRPAGERVSGVPDSRAAQTGRPPRPCPAPPFPALAALLRTLRVPTSTGCPVVLLELPCSSCARSLCRWDSGPKKTCRTFSTS